ncbi:hypothetical protein BDF14DRAFT_1771462 [Spinellus fusiger]|nr:hypothetical protein BDF14DRAFT_1771462 [Spinellus fusiger]
MPAPVENWLKRARQIRLKRKPKLSLGSKKTKSSFPLPSAEKRKIYVNMSLPQDEVDDYGQPIRIFIRNKIRTAKYTWYNFLPKNLFEQFRGIANLYFLFLVILQMFPTFSTSASPVLVILPLAAILVLTGAKDAMEDNKRKNTDDSVNHSIAYTLSQWKNINIPEYKVSRGRRWLNSLASLFTRWLPQNKDESLQLSRLPTTLSLSHMDSIDVEPPTPSSKSSFGRHLRAGSPFTQVFKKKKKMPYRPGQVPHSVLQRTAQNGEKSKNKKSKKNKQFLLPKRPMDKRWQPTQWKNVQVGDFVYLRDGEPIPADIVVLSSSEPDGLCYVETQNLDGETNLKIKRSVQATMEMSTPEDCERAQFYVESEAPHANLYSYNGVLKWKVETNDDGIEEQKYPGASISRMSLEEAEFDVVYHEKSEAITGSSLLLRGCMLRNTGWVIGLVLFTGNETKIMLNSGKTPSKRSKMEKATNPHVIANFILLFVLCVICSIAASIVFNSTSSSNFFEQPDAESASLEGFLMFWTTLVIYQNIIPISLYISVQIVKTAAAYFIHTDIDMYNTRLDQPCVPKTWNISDDLGQVEYIFSDKTGTLTQNIMEFRRCTINGVVYGLGETEAAVGAKLRDNPNAAHARSASEKELEQARIRMSEEQAKLFEHRFSNPNSPFVDPLLYQDIGKKDTQSQSIIHFFSALAFCHTVIPEIPDPNQPNIIDYKAQSPDEAALVATARDVGFTFVAREQDMIKVDAMGEERAMQLLNVLEFNSTRKRMSVIMRSPLDGRIVLLCKGADSVIYERLSKELKEDDEGRDQKRVREETLQHLAVFANDGLRTLCIACRVLEESEYQQWALRYKTASNSITNRDEEIESVCEEIEQSLTLIGGTAIEDKLQDGVPETIAVLAKAGIKIWVLTGDKIETAINIGFACNLLTKDMLLLSVNARDADDTMDQLRQAQAQVNEKSDFQKCALVIDGESLKYALESPCKKELLILGTQCMAVLCCRVSPMQKARVVNLVKKGLKVMTLAIGDGANDVSMIQEANVGVGISGEEGRQAVMASDYAIGQFCYLSKLLLVHGRWSYLRTSEMILTFFYKNIMWTLVLFWYQLFCGFSGTMMFDYSYITLYNLVFTSLPCIFAGVLDQDLKAPYSFKYPQLYLMGIRNDKFPRSRFYWTVLDAIYQSAVCFAIPYMVFVDAKMNSNGYDFEGVYELGTFIAGIAVIVANALVGFTIYSWTYVMALVLILSSVMYFVWTGIYGHIMSFTFYGENVLFQDGAFWLCLIITFAICMLPRYVTKYYLHMYYPFDNDIVREIVLCNGQSVFDGYLGRRDHPRLEEEIPINLSRTHTGQSTMFINDSIPMETSPDNTSQEDIYGEGNGYMLTEPSPVFKYAKLNRTMTAASGKSEIMYMQSGQRASFTGFAYSSDDAHVFDEYRKSVYRRNSSASLSPSFVPFSKTDHHEKSNGKGSDWMPLNKFKLKRYETDPQPQNKSVGWKMINAVKSKMSPRQPRSSDFPGLQEDANEAEGHNSIYSSNSSLPPQSPDNSYRSTISHARLPSSNTLLGSPVTQTSLDMLTPLPGYQSTSSSSSTSTNIQTQPLMVSTKSIAIFDPLHSPSSS